MSRDRVEWEHINRVLVECGGNISEAARPAPADPPTKADQIPGKTVGPIRPAETDV
jgi:hypothetical protein